MAVQHFYKAPTVLEFRMFCLILSILHTLLRVLCGLNHSIKFICTVLYVRHIMQKFRAEEHTRTKCANKQKILFECRKCIWLVFKNWRFQYLRVSIGREVIETATATTCFLDERRYKLIFRPFDIESSHPLGEIAEFCVLTACWCEWFKKVNRALLGHVVVHEWFYSIRDHLYFFSVPLS